MDFIRNLGWPELLIILILILLFFGGKKVNELARGLGESKREIKKIKQEVKPDDKSEK